MAQTSDHVPGDEEIKRAAKFFSPNRSVICTQAFSNFLADYHENIDSFMFTVRLVSHADQSRVVAAKALLVGAKPEEREALEKSADPDVALRQLKKFAKVQSRNLTNAAVNGFQRYFSEIIQAAAIRRPEILRSGETIRVDEVLRFNRHKELVSFLIDKKINEFSYGGIKGMEIYFRERLGIEMFQGEAQRSLLTAFIELRNINVHNGGIVNDLFLRKVGVVDGFEFSREKPYHVELDKLITLGDNAIQTAISIDEAVAKKFSIKRKSHKLWSSPQLKNPV